jgi:outer membrane protein insertion porin family
VKHSLSAVLGAVALMVGLLPTTVSAQVRIGAGVPIAPSTSSGTDLTNYADPKEYEIGGLTVTGTRYLDPNSLVSLTGLKVGDKVRIPGEAVGSSIRKLMESGLLDDVELFATNVTDSKIYLSFQVKDRPRLMKVNFQGIRKGEQESLKDKVKLNLGRVITPTVTKNTQLAVRKFFVDKGYLNTKVKTTVIPDSARNNATMRVSVDKGQKVKIEHIAINGREQVEDSKVRLLSSFRRSTKKISRR